MWLRATTSAKLDLDHHVWSLNFTHLLSALHPAIDHYLVARQRSSERCPSRSSSLALSGFTPSYDPLLIRRLRNHMTCSSTSSSSALPFSKLASGFKTAPSSPLHIRLPSPFSPSPQPPLQSSDCHISYLACLSQLTTTSLVCLRSCGSPLTPLTMANFRQGRSVTALPLDPSSTWAAILR